MIYHLYDLNTSQSINFFIHSLVRFLIMPLTIFWIILLTGIILYLFKSKRTGLVTGVLSRIWLEMISTPFLPQLLASSLENRFPPLFESPKLPTNDTVYILVLGGGSHGKCKI